MHVVRNANRKLSFALQLVREGSYRETAAIVRSKLWYSEAALGLVRDLTGSFPSPEPRIPISVRPVRPTDVSELLDTGEPGISAAERFDRLSRLHLLDAGFASCFVAVTDDDRPCYIQWLISPDENPILDQAFGGMFPPLAADEMLLEGAYTSTGFRGLRIMPAAMALLAERAAALGASRALTFVGEDNVPSLKGCERAGFYPFLRRHAVHRVGFRRVNFSPLAGAGEATS